MTLWQLLICADKNARLAGLATEIPLDVLTRGFTCFFIQSFEYVLGYPTLSMFFFLSYTSLFLLFLVFFLPFPSLFSLLFTVPFLMLLDQCLSHYYWTGTTYTGIKEILHTVFEELFFAQAAVHSACIYSFFLEISCCNHRYMLGNSTCPNVSLQGYILYPWLLKSSVWPGRFTVTT